MRSDRDRDVRRTGRTSVERSIRRDANPHPVDLSGDPSIVSVRRAAHKGHPGSGVATSSTPGPGSPSRSGGLPRGPCGAAAVAVNWIARMHGSGHRLGIGVDVGRAAGRASRSRSRDRFEGAFMEPDRDRHEPAVRHPGGEDELHPPRRICFEAMGDLVPRPAQDPRRDPGRAAGALRQGSRSPRRDGPREPGPAGPAGAAAAAGPRRTPARPSESIRPTGPPRE